jgi:hypothetical protein
MMRSRTWIAVLAALVVIILIWALWPADIEDDITNQTSPQASDEDITAPERVEPVEGQPEEPAPAE